LKLNEFNPQRFAAGRAAGGIEIGEAKNSEYSWAYFRIPK